ncbi:MAG: hypothetical protein AB7E73_08240 [Burkholderiales bacterium]
MKIINLIPQAARGRLCVAASAFLLCFASAAFASEQAAAPAQPSNLDSVARLIAGLVPSNNSHAELAESKAWQNHSAAMLKSWSGVRDGQLAAMKTWRATQLPPQCPVGRTLFYPFSGPDFLNAWTLFPDCETYVMFGLEPIGRMPDPAAMGPKEFAKMLATVRDAMANLFERNYFVTNTMRRNLRTEQLQGVVPIFAMSMVLSGAEMVSVGPAPFPKVTGKQARLDGVTIEYRTPGARRLQRVIYYSVDISDKGLESYPEFLSYLRELAPTTTLIKAASYLMHIREFSKIRGVLLDTSEFLVQDDTGIPYNFLVKRGFEIKPYGTYQKPIPPFEPQYQPSLMSLYQASKPPALPFRFGYHTTLAQNRSTLLVGRRAPAPAAAAAPAPQRPDAR